jgi:hypothetical protein
MRFGLIGAIVGLSLMVAAPVAQAAQRYAAPAGSGAVCTQEIPCSLQEAIEKAKSKDEVIVTAGTYSPAVEIKVPVGATGVQIHGELGGPMPKITGASTNYPPIYFEDIGGRLSYLDISNTGEGSIGAICPYEGVMERIRARAVGKYAMALVAGGTCLVRDSIALAQGEESAGFSASGFATGKASARNVTAIATGPDSVGIRSVYNDIFSGTFTLVAQNMIGSGTGSDLAVFNGSGTARMEISYSNFDSPVLTPGGQITGGNNQTAAPIFVDPANGDYREAPGSPTIDAGSTDQIGALDLEGNPRNQGAAPDIGAFEAAAPPPPPVPAIAIESLSVAPKAFRAVNAGGAIFSRKSHAPVGSTVSFAISRAGTVDFSVERAVKGRRVGKRCAKQTKSNGDHKRCTLFSRLKSGFADNGAAGQNRFQFSGRVGGKGLKPGSYRLVGEVGDSVKRAPFEVVP